MAKFIFDEWIEEFLTSAIYIFNWDSGNLDKSADKHGVTIKETESAFYDENILVLGKQVSPIATEVRYGILGMTETRDLLFISFTLRHGHIRVISARNANKNERSIYES